MERTALAELPAAAYYTARRSLASLREKVSQIFSRDQDELKEQDPSVDAASIGGSDAPRMQRTRSVITSSRAGATVMSMASQQQSKQQLAAAMAYLPRYVIHPRDWRYRCWWWLTIIAVTFTAWYEPYVIAFSEYPGLGPPGSAQAILLYLLILVFTTDMALSMYVAVYDQEVLVTDLGSIRQQYLRRRFWLDLVTTVPLDVIVMAACGLEDTTGATARYLSLLRLLRLGRLYRLRELFQLLEYNTKVSLLAVMLVRNMAFVAVVVHMAACGLYFIAAQGNFDQVNTWVGASGALMADKNTVDRYMFSIYFTVTTFATVGYGEFHAYSVPECTFLMIYMLVNLLLSAYILGTITLLVVKSDEATGKFRDRMHALESYTSMHNVPATLKDSMADHLRLHFSSQEASDEEVLAIYPAAIRRRILRHLYLSSLKRCYLFQGCKRKFFDALLAAAHIEMFMPGVEVLSEGEHVQELHILVAGTVKVQRSRLAFVPDDMAIHIDGTGSTDREGSTHGGSSIMDANATVHQAGATSLLGAGEAVGELPFFTDMPSMEAARCESVCRALVISKAAFARLEEDYPISCRALLDSLQARAQARAQLELSRTGMAHLLAAPDSDLAAYQHVAEAGVLPETARHAELTLQQQDVVASLLRVKQVVQRHLARADEKRTNEFLSAASRGDVQRVRAMLQQRFQPDAADYDGRTALHLASAKGTAEVLQLLLVAGANPGLLDALGNSPLLEAVKCGQDKCVVLLLGHGAKLGLGGAETAALLCSCAAASDLPQLRRLLRAGADVDAGDYDMRSALHVAAADGNLAAVRVLVEEGGAALGVKDRWGSTALDEARRSRSHPVVQFLESKCSREEIQVSKQRYKAARAQAMLEACAAGDLATIRTLVDQDCPADAADYDARTGLMLAAATGRLDVAAALLAAGANAALKDNFGHSALWEACHSGHDAMVELLVGHGGSLALALGEEAAALCSAVLERRHDVVQRYLKAGADPLAGDYDQRTALHIAAAEGDLAAVQLLVAAGGCHAIDPVDRWGNTPLDEARRVRSQQVVHYLEGLSTQQQVAASLGKYLGQQAHALVAAAHRGDLAAVQQLLLVEKVEADAADYDGRTALQVASAQGHADVAAALLAAGASPSAVALLQACRAKHAHVVQLLVAPKADGAVQKLGRCEEATEQLCRAARAGDVVMLEVLLRAGADANGGGCDMRTPLHVAAAEGHLRAVELLVAVGGADVTVQDRWGNTPLSEAQRINAGHVADYLRRAAGRVAGAGAGAGAGADSQP